MFSQHVRAVELFRRAKRQAYTHFLNQIIYILWQKLKMLTLLHELKPRTYPPHNNDLIKSRVLNMTIHVGVYEECNIKGN